MTELNNIITEVTIALKQDKSLSKLIEKYGEEKIADAMVFINHEKLEEIYETEEDDYE